MSTRPQMQSETQMYVCAHVLYMHTQYWNKHKLYVFKHTALHNSLVIPALSFHVDDYKQLLTRLFITHVYLGRDME